MKFRVVVLLLLYKCLVFATEPAASEPTCPLKMCTDVLKDLGATEKQLKDLEIRLAKSEAQIEEIKKEKQVTVPRTRSDFLRYSRQLTLDLNTVNKYIRLSEGNTVITRTDTNQWYSYHPDRFEGDPQVLCRDSVSDRRSYWEVEWSGDVYIAVAYKSISRKGESDYVFGGNYQSWCLVCFSEKYAFRHNSEWTDLPVKPISSRVGVYVDHSAGTLSFYSVSGDTMILLYTVQTTFTEPLYPGIRVITTGSSVKLI